MASSGDDAVIQDTGRLLEFLAAVAREVQSRPVRDFRRHEAYLLPQDVPEHSRIRLGPRAGEAAWLVVPRLDEEAQPELPAQLEGYVRVDSLDDLDGLPELKPDFDNEDFDEQREALDDWTESVWLAWSTRTKPVREARRLYQQVLSMRLLVQRQQATHEIAWGHCVLGLDRAGGILTPLLVTRVQIELDDESGALSIVPDGVPELELDALEGMSLEGMEDLAQLRASLTNSPPVDPWDVEALDLLNRRIVAPLGLDAHTSDSLDLPVTPSAPTVTRAWILAARPRPARHQRFYDELAQALRDRAFLPESLASVVALEQDLDKTLRALDLDDTQDWAPVGSRLLMPLPTNDEQERIARQLASARGVTVQGPPGTGKSHTIVNLVSHLMAHGKRVLVTAQNEQALQVLRDKFPPELRDLTVSVLGSSPTHMDALRASIQAVLDIASQVDPAAEAAPIAALGAQIDQVREDLRRAELQLIDALRSERSEFILPAGPALAPQVAMWVHRTASDLGFIPDRLDQSTSCPMTTLEFSEFLALTNELDGADIREYGLHRPAGRSLPLGSDLRQQTERLNSLKDLLADLEEGGLDLDAISVMDVESLESLAREVTVAADRLEALQARWTRLLCLEIRTSKDTAAYWADVIEQSRQLLSRCQELKRGQAGHEVRVPDGDPRTQQELVAELKRRFSEGKGVPKLFKSELRGFFAQCAVDDLEPRTVEEAALLESEIQLQQLERQLQRLFKQASAQVQLPVPDIDPHFLSTSTQVLKDLEDVQDWESRTRSQLRQHFTDLFDRIIDVDDTTELRTAARILAQAAAQQEVATLEAKLSELEGQLLAEARSDRASAKWTQLRIALNERRWDVWQATLDDSDRITTLGDGIQRWKTLGDRLQARAPLWARRIREDGASEAATGDPQQLLEMWTWRQARTWLDDLHGQADIRRLMDRAHQLQRESERLVLKLAQRSTAVAVRNNLDDSKRRALTSWQQALQRYGKGTGKNAPHWMQVARSQLPIAMGAIPAWIMPIHRVIENFDPRVSELFDVVIVDESSQCDLLSVGVLALGRKTVVVGDDKQTSPAAVGIDTARIQQLQNSYLAGIDQRQLLTADESLYGLAERVFPSVILLREHFRCLPEIIRFSNRYYDDRILPLREPLDFDIGEPLQGVHVEEGARTGASSNAINRVEAQELVSQVIACHEDPRYEGLTFGVVVLQGNQQGPLIERLLIEQLGFEAFEARKLRVGSPPDFQGDERNVIFISVVADDNSYQAVRNQDKQRVNVAASRAQDQLWVFYSMDPGTLNHQDQRRALIEYVRDGGKSFIPTANQLDACESDFERSVLRDIVARGYTVYPQYPVGGYRIDLVVEGSDGRIAVECDGDKFHGADQYDNDIRRQRVLERLGWNFWRVRASEYYLDSGHAMATLWDRLEGSAEDSIWAAPLPDLQDFEDEPAEDDNLVARGDIELVEILALDDDDEDAEDVEQEDDEGVELADEFEEEPEVELHFEPEDGDEVQSLGEGDNESRSWSEILDRAPDYDFGSDDRGLWVLEESALSVFAVPMAEKATGTKREGTAIPCTFGFDAVGVDMSVIDWGNGNGEVRCDEIYGGGAHLSRLKHGGRLGYYELTDGRYFAELRIMRQGDREMPTAHNPVEGEYDGILGWSLEAFLIDELGIDEMGTREGLLADASTRKSTPVAIWTNHIPAIPAVLYVATRVIPLMRLDGDY